MGVDRRNEILAWGFYNIQSYRMMQIMEENGVTYESLVKLHPKDAMGWLKKVKAAINPQKEDDKTKKDDKKSK